MVEHIVKILKKENVTHDTLRFITEKPGDYIFTPGQATEVAINQENWKDKKRPFTFASLNEDPNLEFIIKTYKGNPDSVTDHLNTLKEGDELIIHDIWGTIKYKGPGVFIAGGAGITPFIAILRQLKKENKMENNTLLFSNKTKKDIILEEELKEILKDKAIFILTDEPEGSKQQGYEYGRIDKEFLKKHIEKI